jgi:hypothetical protein
VGTKDWLERALIQHIEFQTGKWYIWIEPAYSVFRIYPYLSKGSPQPSVYQGIVLKVKGALSVEDLLAAIRNRTPTIKIDEYDVFGAGSASVQRYSRPHGGGGPATRKQPRKTTLSSTQIPVNAYQKLAHHPILYFPALLAVTSLMPTGLVTNVQTPVISDEIGLPVLRAS